uniref:Biopolymer transporter ExbD n=1 Tax=Schlesneria paludicola TaxID=360056 RepID=A0A7C4QSS0_9PLAN
MPLKTIPLDEPGINLTSMLDVVMLLIMFFMAGTQFKDVERQYDIQLPTVQDATAVSGLPDEIVVNVQRDGQLVVRAEVRTPEGLEALLREARERYPGQAVVVRGDADVPYRHIMHAMGACRRAGIRNLSLAYRPGEP